MMQPPLQLPKLQPLQPPHTNLTLEVPCSTPGSRISELNVQGAPGSAGGQGAGLQGEGARRPSSTGVFQEGMSDADDGPGNYKQFEPYVRPSQLGQPMPPAKGSALLGRGVTKMKEVLRFIRKNLLAIEESVPWELVEDGWRSRRSAWRKALKHLEAGTGAAAAAAAHARVGPTEGLVVAVACAILELHEALLTDKSPATGGVFARGSVWESRLYELAEGGTNYMCLMAVSDEMHEAVRVWLSAQGKGLGDGESGDGPPKLPTPRGPPIPGSAAAKTGGPPPAIHMVVGLSILATNGPFYSAAEPLGSSKAPANEQQDKAEPLRYHYLQQQQQQQLQQLQYQPNTAKTVGLGALEGGPMVITGMEGLDRGMYGSVLRAFRALEASAVEGDHMLSQVAVDRILGLGRQSFAALKSLLAQEEATVTSGLEHLAAARPDLHSLLGISAEELSKMSESDLARNLLASPALRNAPTRGIESEPDTDEDMKDATDLEDSD